MESTMNPESVTKKQKNLRCGIHQQRIDVKKGGASAEKVEETPVVTHGNLKKCHREEIQVTENKTPLLSSPTASLVKSDNKAMYLPTSYVLGIPDISLDAEIISGVDNMSERPCYYPTSPEMKTESTVKDAESVLGQGEPINIGGSRMYKVVEFPKNCGENSTKIDESFEEILPDDSVCLVNVPLSLQVQLTSVDKLCIRRKNRRSQYLKTVMKKPTVHEVVDRQGVKLFTVLEKIKRTKAGCLMDDFTVELEVLDQAGTEVLHMRRESEMLREIMHVFTPSGLAAGQVRELWSIFTDNFCILDANGNVAIMVQGCMTTCWSQLEMGFKLMSADGTTEVGSIRPFYGSQIAKAEDSNDETFDHFAVTFPVELDHNLKSVLLGACFLIDILSFYCWDN